MRSDLPGFFDLTTVEVIACDEEETVFYEVHDE